MPELELELIIKPQKPIEEMIEIGIIKEYK